MKKTFLILAAFFTCSLFVCAFIPSALAVEFNADAEVFMREPLLDDGYIAGGMVTVDEDASGDLYIGGGTITINGNVEGDLVVGGGDIIINGNVGDDLRVAGGSISLNGNVGDDVIATGGKLDISSDTLISGSLIIGNGYANILGTVNEDILGGGGRIMLGGQVYRDVVLEVQDTLVLSDSAQINGNLEYTSFREAELDSEQVGGYIEFNKQTVEDESFSKQVENFFTRWHLVFLLVSYLSLLVLTIAFVIIEPAAMAGTAKVAKKHPWRSLGLGFVIVVCSIAAIIILMVTLIGIPLALVFMAVLFILMYATKVFAGTFIGSLLIRPKNMTKMKLFGITALGLFVLIVLDIVPILGWFVHFAVLLIAFGAICTHKKELYDKLKLQDL